jgi:host factor-I protein
MIELSKKSTGKFNFGYLGFKESAVENKAPAQNIQDLYLNALRKDRVPVTVFLIGGVRLVGKIKGFDKYSVVLEANNQDQLIFKHAISTVTVAKSVSAPPPVTT